MNTQQAPETTTESATLKILSIDAWADNEPKCWSWNQWYNAGEISEEALNWSPRKLLKHFREIGLLNPASAGKCAIEDDQYNIVIVDRANRRPLYAIEYGSHY
ncbi:hypothetical protein [Staphylococcus aureus]|uniref:hypothetical protein n=1 Tax=Staphylococcus aureus TaxID=1280 RepID=UPI0015830B9C|nr:hypothetical protein [Staphylococcus aureus]